MRRWQKLTLAGCLVVALLLAFVAFILPGIVRTQAEQRLSAATGRSVAIKRITLNPLTGRVSVEGFRMSERGSPGPFVAFSSVRARLSLASLWRRAPVVAEATLTSPAVHLVRTGPNSYNFSDLLAKKPGAPSEPSEPTRFSLNNITVTNGTVDFLDQGLPQPKRHQVSKLTVQIPFISNIPYFADRYVDPRLDAVVNGAPFAFAGKLKPFAKGLEATVSVKLSELDIPYYAAYLPTDLPLRIDSGRLTTDLEISHRLEEGARPDIILSGALTLSRLSLAELDGSPLLNLPQAKATIGKSRLMTSSYLLDSVSLAGLQVYVSRDRSGAWNFERLNTEKRKEARAKRQVMLRELRLTDGALRFRDEMPPGGFTAEVERLSLTVAGFTTGPGKPADYVLSCTTGRQEQIDVAGTFSAEPLAATARLQLKEVVAEAYYPYLATTLRSAVGGRLDLAGELTFSKAEGLSVDKIGLQIRQLAVRLGADEGLRLPLVTVEGGTFRLHPTERSLAIERVALSGGDLRFSRDQQGAFSFNRLLLAPTSGTPATGKKGDTPFTYLVRNVDVSKFTASFTDRLKEEAPRFDLRGLKLTAANVTGPKFGPIPFSLSSGYGREGQFSAKGRVVPQPFQLKADCTIKRLPLTDAEPYLPEGVNVTLVDGKLTSTLALDLALKGGALTGSFRGDAEVRDFYSLDPEGQDDLLKWETLRLDGLSGTVKPFNLQLQEVTLTNYFARVIVTEKGKFNLQELYTPPSAPPQSDRSAAPATPPAPAAPAAATGSPVKIDAVTLQNGTLAFSDRHLTGKTFSTTMLNLGGRVSGLSAEAPAEVDLRGNLANQSPLQITGRINPLRGDLFLDLAVVFRDIELSPLTPYSGTYLGYAIDKGKLTLQLKYLVDRKQLTAEHKIFIDQFTFGDRVESDKATSLPVRLAVSLLKDRNGEIKLDLPVTGRTDDPKFSIWGVVLQMLKNLLVKAATAPFSLLQAAFGGGEDFSAVTFAPGTSRLSPTEAEKLRNLAKALQDRPALKVEISGYVDRERDPEGYRGELLLKKMRTEKFLATAKGKQETAGQSPETMEITAAETSTWLKAVYEKEKFPRPRTIIGTLKSLPDAEMRKLIITNTKVTDEQLGVLARERVAAVRDFLVTEGKLPVERLFEKSGDPLKPPQKDGQGGSRVEFGIVAP